MKASTKIVFAFLAASSVGALNRPYAADADQRHPAREWVKCGTAAAGKYDIVRTCRTDTVTAKAKFRRHP